MKKATTALLILVAFSYLYHAKSKDMVNIQEEIWKDIPSFEGYYQASNLGRIKSLPRKVWNHQCFMVRKERIIKQSKLPDGYVQVGLKMPNDKQRRYMVHRIIGLAFHPNPENKEMINHKDGIKDNNNESNLEWSTRSENAKHSFIIGLQCNKGSNHPLHKVTDEDVLEIRNRYLKGESTYKIFNSKDYPISYTNVKDIVARRTWSHI